MARPKLEENQKKVSKSFALDYHWNDILNYEIPPGERSAWICGVVIEALKEFQEVAASKIE